MEKTVLDCSYISSISSSSETSEATSADKFWKKYKRGRRHSSFWKILKERIFPTNNKDIYFCNTNKLLAIDQFYSQFHQENSEHLSNNENILMIDEQEIFFVHNHHTLKKNLEIGRATTLLNRSNTYMYYSSLV
jgi:hypothetical protein